MPENFRPKRGWGARHQRAALSITFDNFGEAADLETGDWGDRTVGEHFTAAFLPALVKVLEGVRATYFVEASNAEIYPGPLRLWRAAGHEIGLHAWRHEVWSRLAAPRRRELLERSMAAMRAIGIEPLGFRPPGGAIPDEAWHEFEEVGLSYCSGFSSLGLRPVGRLMSVPFDWPAVDAYNLEMILGPVRVQRGDAEAPSDIASWCDRLAAFVDEALDEGGHRTVIFHPMFLAKSDEKLWALQFLIRKAREEDVWIAPAGDVARFAADELDRSPATLTA